MPLFYYRRDKDVLASTPRVGSRSTRTWAQQHNFPELTPQQVRLSGLPVTAYIRDPIDRFISNLSRLNSIKSQKVHWKDLLHYGMRKRDAHVIPQTAVHKMWGVDIDTWILFEEFPFSVHENKSHKRLDSVRHELDLPEFFTIFREDYKIRDRLIYERSRVPAGPHQDSGEFSDPEDRV